MTEDGNNTTVSFVVYVACINHVIWVRFFWYCSTSHIVQFYVRKKPQQCACTKYNEPFCLAVNKLLYTEQCPVLCTIRAKSYS